MKKPGRVQTLVQVVLTLITTIIFLYHLQCSTLQYNNVYERSNHFNGRNYNGSFFLNSNYVVQSPFCHIPNFNAHDDSIKHVINPWPEISCSNKTLLTQIVYNDLKREVALEIVKKTIEDYTAIDDPIRCCYRVIKREWQRKRLSDKDDDRYTLSPPQCFVNMTILPKNVEFIYVYCSSLKVKKLYQTLHSVVFNKQPKVKVKSEDLENKYSVLLFGIDSISRLNFERTMPLTKKFLEKNDWAYLEGYNKVADNTFPNLAAILTGRTQKQLSDECFKTNMLPMDNCPFLWKNFSDMGYLTSYVEDEVFIGTFNANKYGFLNPPTDYYSRPWMIAGMNMLPRMKHGGRDYCLGQKIQAEYLLDYSTQFVKRMQNRPYFKLLWLNSFSHNEVNMPSVMDRKIRHIMEEIQPYLNKTFVIFLSDHGVRIGPIRKTYLGWLEERLPYIYFWVPSSYRQKYPQKYVNLRLNKNRLTSPFDVHATLQDILYGKVMQPPVACPKCKSLFEKTGWNRSCGDASIPHNWCTCSDGSESEQSSVKNPEIVSAVNRILTMMNNFMKEKRNNFQKETMCAVLKIRKILSVRSLPRDRMPSPYNMTQNIIVFQVTPGNGLFEIIWSPETQLTVANVSRIDSYNGQSYCIVENDDLRKLCFCLRSSNKYRNG